MAIQSNPSIIVGGEVFVGPAADGTAGQVLVTDGSKNLSFTSAPAAAGVDTQVIFNDGGVLAGSTFFNFDKVTKLLSVGGVLMAEPGEFSPPQFRLYATEFEPSGVEHDIYLDDGTNTANGLVGFRRYDGAAWQDITQAAPGSDTQVLFNDGGGIGADAALTFDKTTGTLAINASGGSAALSVISDSDNATLYTESPGDEFVRWRLARTGPTITWTVGMEPDTDDFRIFNDVASRYELFIDIDASTPTLVFGGEPTSSLPTSVILTTSGGSGTDIAGGDVTIRPGPSTGSATPSSFIVTATAAIGSGITAQTPFDAVTINGSGMFLGNGQTSATPAGLIVNATGGSGTNIAGANLTLRSGLSTGSATPASTILTATAAGGTGATAQTPFNAVTINGSGVAIANYGATVVPFSVTGDAAQSSHLVDITNSGGTAGDLFCVDSSGQVGIGAPSPAYILHVIGANAKLVGQSSSDFAGEKPSLTFRRSRGTTASPAAVQNADRLFQFLIDGHNGTDWDGFRQVFEGEATENWTVSAAGFKIGFYTRANGTVGPASLRMLINNAGKLIVGNGSAEASPTAGEIGGTGGFGTNIAGASLTLAGGRATGNAAGGSLIFQTSTAGASGTALQTLTTRLTLSGAGVLTFADAVNIATNATTGTKIGTATSQKIGFFNTTPRIQPSALTTQLTAITHTAPGTPDFALQDLVDSGAGSAFGFATKDEGNTLLSAVANLQTRVQEIENALSTAAGGLGLVA